MPTIVIRRLGALSLASVLWLALAGQRDASAQKPLLVDPSSHGLAIPAGPVSPGAGQRVMTHDATGAPVVAKLFAQVGKHVVVLLPDGELVARSSGDFIATDRKFVPATKESLAERLAGSGPLRGFRTKLTRHYVYAYNTSEEFALVTSRILESMIRGMMAHAKSQRIDVHQPEVPLVVIMFRTEKEFQEFRRVPESVLAYYHPLSNWVVLHEQSPLAKIKAELAIQQSISTIAHEGAHQILHNIGVQTRLSTWPMWLSEGLAEYYAPTSFGRKLRWMGAGRVNDLRMFELEIYIKSQEARRTDAWLIEETVQAGRLTSAGYASAWSLTHFLATTRRADFNEYVKQASQLGPFETLGKLSASGVVPANLDSFSSHFGADLAGLERRWASHLNRLPYNDPFAERPHYVATLALPAASGANRDANLFHTRELARKWVSERIEIIGQPRNQVRTRISEFPNRVMAERFVREWLGGR